MAKNAFTDWDTTASNNTDVGGIGILGTNAVSNFDDALRTIMAQLRSGVDGEVVYAAKSGNYTAVLNDNNAWHRYTANATVSLTAAATLGANWHYYVQADGGVVTIDPNAAETINGATTLVLQSGQTASVICTGSAFIAVVEGTVITGPGNQGYLFGLTLSNNASDATNDIDIATGVAAADTSPYYLMQLASSLTKRLDAAWAVGSGNGGLDTGSIANTTYHIWLIQRSDTGVVDALFSASATAPTMPTNYDRKRRIGSIIRSVGAILAFYQDDDKFFLTSPVVDRSSTSALAVALLALTVPAGVAVRPILRNTLASSTSPNIVNLMGNAAQGTGGATTVQQINSTATTVTDIVVIDGTFTTNTSSQIYYGVTISSGTIGTNSLSTLGWYDSRGR